MSIRNVLTQGLNLLLLFICIMHLGVIMTDDDYGYFACAG